MKNRLGRRLAASSIFGGLEVILEKIYTTLLFVIVVRALPREEIGIISVAQSWVLVILLLNFLPFRSLIRDHAKFKDRLAENISAYIYFWFFQAVVLILIAGGGVAVLAQLRGERLLGLVILAMAMQMQFQSFQWLSKVAFFIHYRQSYVTGMTMVLGAINLAAALVFLQRPSLWGYVLLMLGLNALAAGVWLFQLVRRLGVPLLPPKDAIAIIQHGLFSYGIWHHFQSVLFDVILLIDPLVLWFFAPYQDIGDYGIAQRINSLLLILPGVLANNLELGTAASGSNGAEKTMTQKFLLASAGLGISQFLFLLIGGKLLLKILFDVNPNGPVYSYMIIMGIGVMILNFARPLMGRLNAKAYLGLITRDVFLPACIAAISAYALLASQWGPLGTAYGNIFAYGFLAFLLVRATLRYTPFQPDLHANEPDPSKEDLLIKLPDLRE